METMTKTKITVQALVNAPVKKVWEAWTTPAAIMQWNFASDDWYCPGAANDLRVGGKFTSRMEAKDGSFGFDFEGIYDEVVDLKKITYRMPDGRQATTTFTGKGEKTEVTTIFDAETENSVELQQGGWQAILIVIAGLNRRAFIAVSVLSAGIFRVRFSVRIFFSFT